jgi:E3 ubiquitin-protein ligase BRE1
MTEKLSDQETNGIEVKNQVEDLQWEVNKLLSYNDKLVNHIQDLIEKYRRLQQMYGSEGPGSKKEKKVEISDSEVSNLRREIEELREQASNRLNELEKLHKTQRETLKELEKLRIDIRQLPESVIVETAEYKCLQSKFSVIYNDTLQLRATLDETRNQLFTMRTNHLKHIEQMEVRLHSTNN